MIESESEEAVESTRQYPGSSLRETLFNNPQHHPIPSKSSNVSFHGLLLPLSLVTERFYPGDAGSLLADL